MPKIIGKIIGVQEARDGKRADGTEWHARTYVIEDETHRDEGVAVSTFSTSIMQQIGKHTHGELIVEVDYLPKLRYWDGKNREGAQVGEPRWNQTMEITGFRVLRGGSATVENPQTQTVEVQAPPAQPAPVPNDLPF